MSFSEILYKILIQGGSYLTILKGFYATVRISLFALIAGTVLAAVVCALRMSKVKIFRFVAAVYIIILRGSPVLMLLMLMYYGIFARSSLEAETIAVITFSLNVAAHIAELLRSSISATDFGQVEAARTLGFPFDYPAAGCADSQARLSVNNNKFNSVDKRCRLRLDH